MDFRHLQTFRAVLREGSFLKAARALRLAQPTVTLHIQELEADVGLELFDRRGRSRPPTPAGEELAARALPILDAVESLQRTMAELRDGRYVATSKSSNVFYGLVNNDWAGVASVTDVTVAPPYAWRP